MHQPVSRPADAVDGPRQLSSVRARIAAYVALCKPRIVELLLITAVPTLFLAYKGLPSLLVTVVVNGLARLLVWTWPRTPLTPLSKKG